MNHYPLFTENLSHILKFGAGDAFIGSFLYQLSADGIDACSLADVSAEKMETYLEFSNRYCAKSVQKAGAIASYPTMDEM